MIFVLIRFSFIAKMIVYGLLMVWGKVVRSFQGQFSAVFGNEITNWLLSICKWVTVMECVVQLWYSRPWMVRYLFETVLWPCLINILPYSNYIIFGIFATLFFCYLAFVISKNVRWLGKFSTYGINVLFLFKTSFCLRLRPIVCRLSR